MKQHLSTISKPKVLEIGVDRGVTFLSLATWLTRNKEYFFLYGVDILVQESTAIQLANLERTQHQKINLSQENSLISLPEMVARHEYQFDLILLDGDHNYKTVREELNYIQHMMHKNSVLIVDDYDGKWGTRDLYYSTRPGYENIKGMLKPDSSEKQGVKNAVDDWFDNDKFKMGKLMQGEPIVITRI